MTIAGNILEFSPPDRLVSIESWGPEWPETHNAVVFTAKGKQTRVILTIRYVSKAARDEAVKTGMADGLEVSYDRLERLARTLG